MFSHLLMNVDGVTLGRVSPQLSDDVNHTDLNTKPTLKTVRQSCGVELGRLLELIWAIL